MKNMDCPCAQDLLEKDALGLLSPEEAAALRTHLEQCPACRCVQATTLSATARFQNVFEKSSDAAPLAKLRWRVQCAQTQDRRVAQRWNFARRFVRIAACLALIVGVVVLTWSRINDVRRAAGTACRDWQLAGVQPGDADGAAEPLVCGARVFALQQNENGMSLVAVNSRSGERLWRVSAAFEGGLASDGQRVFAWVRGADRQMAAYDVATGRLCWQASCPDIAHAVRPQEIVVGGNGVGWGERNTVTWLDARDGQRKWTTAINVGDTLRPKLSAGSGCVVVMGARQVCALSASRGEVLWSRVDAGIANWLEPRVSSDGTRIVVAQTISATVDRLSCIDLRTGREIWLRDIAAPARHILFQDGEVFVRGQKIMAFNGKTGEPLWSLPADGCSPVTLADGKLYLVAGGNGVLAVDAATGVTLWHSAALASCSGVAVSGRMGYLRTTDGVLRAIRLSASAPRVQTQRKG
jgi:outer membrane protein assembly factor BamB